MKRVSLIFNTGKTVELSNIDEYVCGFRYFYVRYMDGNCTAFHRNQIKEVLRVLPGGKKQAIHMKKITKN